MRDLLARGEAPSPELAREIGGLQRSMGDLHHDQAEVHERTSAALKEILHEKQLAALDRLGRPDPTRPHRENLGRFIDQLRDHADFEPDENYLRQMRETVQRLVSSMRLPRQDVDSEVERISRSSTRSSMRRAKTSGRSGRSISRGSSTKARSARRSRGCRRKSGTGVRRDGS
jgi:hypothetical protein